MDTVGRMSLLGKFFLLKNAFCQLYADSQRIYIWTVGVEMELKINLAQILASLAKKVSW